MAPFVDKSDQKPEPVVPSFRAVDIFSVRGKNIVITGGGTGLGLVMARGFVQNGANVWIVGRRRDVLLEAVEAVRAEEEEAEAAAGAGEGSIHALPGDISTKAGCKAIADELRTSVERLDVLINNAAVQRPWKIQIENHADPDECERLVWDGVDDEDFAQTFRPNISGPYFLTSALVPLLRAAPSPSVIIVSSIAAVANQRPVSSLTYGVSKAALCHLGTMLAGRLIPMKIRVNTLLPGTFPTDLTATPDAHGQLQLRDPARRVTLRTPLGRPGRPHEIFGPVLMLASEAGAYMHGAVLDVSGGRQLVAGANDGMRLPEDSYA